MSNDDVEDAIDLERDRNAPIVPERRHRLLSNVDRQRCAESDSPHEREGPVQHLVASVENAALSLADGIGYRSDCQSRPDRNPSTRSRR